MTNTTLNKIHVFPTEASYNANESQVDGTNDLAVIKASGITSYPAFAALFKNLNKNAVISDSLLMQNGYIKLSNGLKIMWGRTDSITVGFPISFDESVYAIFAQETSGYDGSDVQHYVGKVSLNTVTTSGFSFHSISSMMFWMAVGK